MKCKDRSERFLLTEDLAILTGFRVQLEPGPKRGDNLQRAKLLLSVWQSGGDYGN